MNYFLCKAILEMNVRLIDIYTFFLECGDGCKTCTINDADVTNPICGVCYARYILYNDACYGRLTCVTYVCSYTCIRTQLPSPPLSLEHTHTYTYTHTHAHPPIFQNICTPFCCSVLIIFTVLIAAYQWKSILSSNINIHCLHINIICTNESFPL